METWRLFKDFERPLTTAQGLAVDDTLPLSVAEQGLPPTLHLYCFEPSAIVGKYQDIEAALKLDRCRARGIAWNRRSTGGGTVIMGPAILALGLGIRMDHPGLKAGIGGVFQSMSEALILALSELGVRATFAPKNDIHVEGRKIAGLSAASEKGNSLLFHTSLLADFDVGLMLDIMNTPLLKLKDKGYNCFSQRMTTLRAEAGRPLSVEDAAEAVVRGFEKGFGIRFLEARPTPWERETMARLEKERYHDPAWVYSHRHPRTRMGVGRLKTQAGLLEVYLSLSGGAIEHVLITGDFFSTSEAIHRLEGALAWVSARRESIEEKLSAVWRPDMIHALDLSSLTEAILLAKDNQVRL